MKSIAKMIAIAVAVLVSFGASAQMDMKDHSKMAITKTVTVKVSGNCGSCKARIEKAAKINGVTKADWNQSTKVLTVVYDPMKTTIDDIEKKIASVGHDTEKFKADDKTYNALPGCCKYR